MRGDVVKDDFGSHAVFSEQGAFASYMTAAKVLDVISRFQGCAGQASDAVSAYTEVKKNERRAKVMELTKIRVPSHLDASTTFPPPQIMGRKSRPSGYHLKDICTDTHWQDCCGSENLKKVLTENG